MGLRQTHRLAEALCLLLLDGAGYDVPPERCAWCIQELSLAQPEGQVSHGICQRHKAELLKDFAQRPLVDPQEGRQDA